LVQPGNNSEFVLGFPGVTGLRNRKGNTLIGFLLVGINGIKKEKGTGRFQCPNCRTLTDYRRYELNRYFTLFFLPLIPLGSMGEFVRCSRCNAEFDISILNSGSGNSASRLSTWNCRKCGNTNPAEYTSCLNCNSQHSGNSL